MQLNPFVPSGGVQYSAPPVLSAGWAVYLARDAGVDLFAVPIDGSAAAHRINAPLPSSRGVDGRFTATGGRVVFLAPDVDSTPTLFVAPIDGSGAPTPINPPGTFGGFSYYEPLFRVHPDGQRILFLASDLEIGQPELYLGFLGRPVFGWSAPAK